MKKILAIALVLVSVSVFATPKNVMYLVVDEFDNYFDFSAAPYDNITYRGWMTLRPGEVLNQASAGSFYETFGAGMSFVAINIGNFPTPWSAGETVTFRVQQVQDATLPPEDHFPVLDDSIETSELDGTVDDFYGGAGTILGDPWYGDPLALQTPSSVNSTLPSSTRLHQNYPNPFNPTTTIKFDLASDSNVRLNVFNYNGQLLHSLVEGRMNAGSHTVEFDAANLSAGVYFYALESENRVFTNKMILVK